MRKIVALALLVMPFAVRAEQSSFAVPLTPVAHLMTLEAKVNGKGPYRFVFDSGAAGTMRISADLAKSLGLEQVGEVVAGDPSGKNAERRPVLKIDTLELGSAKFTDVKALAGNGGGPVPGDGVVGLGLFKDMTVTLDYPAKELRVGREPLPAKGEHVVPYMTERGIPEIDIDVAGAPLRVDVDTGSPAILSIPASWAGRLPLGEQRVIGRGRTTVNEFEIRAADLKGDMHVAGFTVPGPRVDIVDLFPVANIGGRLLRDFVVTFDTANKRLSLAR